MSVRKKVWNDSNFFCKKVCKIASVRRKIRFNQWESSIYFQILFISTTTHCLLMFVSRFINFININIIHYYYYLYFPYFEILFHQRFISVRNSKVNTWILFDAFSLFMSNFNIFRLKLETKDIERFILRVKNHPVLYDRQLLKDFKKTEKFKHMQVTPSATPIFRIMSVKLCAV